MFHWIRSIKTRYRSTWDNTVVCYNCRQKVTDEVKARDVKVMSRLHKLLWLSTCGLILIVLGAIWAFLHPLVSVAGALIVALLYSLIQLGIIQS